MRFSKAVFALALAVLTCCVITQPSEAVPITGEINFFGTTALDTNNMRTATRVTQFYSPYTNVAGGLSVASATGSFSAIPVGSFARFTAPYVFNPSSAYPNFWQVGGFNFNLLSSTVVFQSSFFLEVHGTGIFTGNGYDPTPGTWSMTRNASDGAYNTVGIGIAPLPDGGSALLFLGIALTCLEALRRKFRFATS